MKAFLWSLCLHIVLLGLLTYHHFAPDDAAKVVPEPPILAYAYQPMKAKPAPAVVVPVVVPTEVSKPQPAVTAAKKTATKAVVKKSTAKKPQVKKDVVKKTPAKAKPQVKTKAAAIKPATAPPERKPFVPVRKPAMVKPMPVAAKPLPKVVPKPAEVVAAKPAEVVTTQAIQVNPGQTNAKTTANGVRQQASAAVTNALEQQKSTANKALQAAKQGDSSGSASWKEKQKQLALEITTTKSEQKPEMGRAVKTFADGSLLIDTNPGCWKVPPAESRQNAIWLSTSVPCKPDTTVEQIDAILQKRRSYSRD